jgi:hypothetical protein
LLLIYNSIYKFLFIIRINIPLYCFLRNVFGFGNNAAALFQKKSLFILTGKPKIKMLFNKLCDIYINNNSNKIDNF